ncbi:MAG: EamA family transporter [Bacillota bacterium]|nr:EamA family transporter [Bacillota bacterium]
MKMLWPILIVIGANTFYNICAKQTPQNLNPFFSLTITYGVAMVLSIAAYFVTAPERDILNEFSKVNWTSYIFGLCILGLEFGYLNVYRVGWEIGTASLVANIGLAVILLFVGFLLYKEAISLRQLLGMAVCAVGLILITKQ